MVDLALDAGHGGIDPGVVGPTGLMEKECNFYIAKKCEEILKGRGVTVKQTRQEDSFLSLSERVQIANDAKAKYFLSIHINSADVDTAHGTEAYVLAKGGEGEMLAREVLSYLVGATGLADRGVKFANLVVLRDTDMPAVLVEVCFISNPSEESLLRDDDFKDKVALAISKGFLSYIGKPYKDSISLPSVNTSTPIISKSSALKDQAKQWAKNNNATPTFISLADLYWNLYLSHGGVNPVVAYAQSALETGYGKFGGKIDEGYKNPCGLKTSTAKDDSPSAHVKFNTWEDGISAHLDHLALYTGASDYPKEHTKDPRHFLYLLGKVKFVEDLSGTWSSAQDYGLKILEIMSDIQETVIKENFENSANAMEHNVDNSSINKDDSNTNNGDSVVSIKNNLDKVSQEFELLKNHYSNVYNNINELEKLMSGKDMEIIKLIEENKELKSKILVYEEVIENVLNMISQRIKK